MRTLGFLTWLPLLVGCRFGFQERPADAPPTPPDAAIDVMIPIDAPPPAVLACGAATKFAMITAPEAVAATATADGYGLIIGQGNDVRGYAYGFEGDRLTAQRGDIPLFTGTPGAMTAIASGTGTLLGIANGDPEPTSTTLVALDSLLAPIGPPVPHDTRVGAAGSLARNSAGTLAFLAAKIQTPPVGEVDLQAVGADGVPRGPVHIAIADASAPSIAPAGSDFLVVWHAYSETSNKVRASVVSMTTESFTTRVEPTIISGSAPTEDAFNARGAYGPGETYLIAWMEKPGNPADHIKVSLRDRNLVAIGPPLDIGMGNQPQVIAGKDDFLVVWHIDGQRLGAARIKPDGTVTPVVIESAGGDVIGMDLVTRAGQPALVWVERAAAGTATVRFDPLCAR